MTFLVGNGQADRAMDVTKPYMIIRFGAMDVTKPYKFIGSGAMVFYSLDPKCKRFPDAA